MELNGACYVFPARCCPRVCLEPLTDLVHVKPRQARLGEGLEGSRGLRPGLDPLDLQLFDAGTDREGVVAMLMNPQLGQV